MDGTEPEVGFCLTSILFAGSKRNIQELIRQIKPRRLSVTSAPLQQTLFEKATAYLFDLPLCAGLIRHRHRPGIIFSLLDKWHTILENARPLK